VWFSRGSGAAAASSAPGLHRHHHPVAAVHVGQDADVLQALPPQTAPPPPAPASARFPPSAARPASAAPRRPRARRGRRPARRHRGSAPDAAPSRGPRGPGRHLLGGDIGRVRHDQVITARHLAENQSDLRTAPAPPAPDRGYCPSPPASAASEISVPSPRAIGMPFRQDSRMQPVPVPRSSTFRKGPSAPRPPASVSGAGPACRASPGTTAPRTAAAR
jgi:hypothetical protein